MDSFYNGFASVCKAARTIFGRTGDMRHGTSHRKQKSITALCLALLLLASGTPRPLPATGLFRRRIPRGHLRPLPGRLENPLHHRSAGRASRMEDRAGDRTRDMGHRRGAYAGRLRPLQGDRRRQARRIHQPVLCPALLLQHLGRKHHPAVRIRHAEDPQPFPRRGVRHLLRRGAVLHQLPAADTETLRVQIRIPEVSEYLLGRVHGALRRRTGQLDRPRRQFDPHFAAPCLRRAPEKLGVADHGMGQ